MRAIVKLRKYGWTSGHARSVFSTKSVKVLEIIIMINFYILFTLNMLLTHATVIPLHTKIK